MQDEPNHESPSPHLEGPRFSRPRNMHLKPLYQVINFWLRPFVTQLFVAPEIDVSEGIRGALEDIDTLVGVVETKGATGSSEHALRRGIE